MAIAVGCVLHPKPPCSTIIINITIITTTCANTLSFHTQAIGQICSTGSITANLNQCVRLVAKAALGGAQVCPLLRLPAPTVAT